MKPHSLAALLLTLCLSATFAATVNAADEAGVSLLRPDSLAGWQHGVTPRGWQIADGTLRGTPGATPLLSGWTLGDFVLRWRWSVAPGATLVVSLPQAPAGEGLEWRLAEGTQAGTLSDAGKTLRPGALITATGPAGHTAELKRSGGKLLLQVDGQPFGEVAVAPERRFGLGLGAEGNDATLSELRLSEPPGQPIFNGQDLSGWWSPAGLISWHVKDGSIDCLNKDGNYLRSEKEYGNFTLTLEYKMARSCNSGIGIRTPRDGWPSADGMELQLEDQPGLKKDSTMSIYGNVEPLGRNDRPEVWNQVVVKADGPMISGWINGQLEQQANTHIHPELKHRLPKGWIGFQDHGGKVEFRNVRVLEAPDGQGLDAWCAPHVRTGPEVLYDRLINPQVLSLEDGIGSGVVSATGQEGPQTLAELTGPGAVVHVGRTLTTGRLAFYFDGASEPAIECAADELQQHVPQLSEQPQPLLTCVPFAKSLKIVLTGAPKAEYRIEYATFPPELPVTSFAPGAAVLPRGWLAAIDYRQHQYGWGTHREFDAAPQYSIEVKNLAAGESAKLADLDGAGVVQWIKLEADLAVVRAQDVQFILHVDGKPSTAVRAPVGYLFPSLRQGVPILGVPSNHESFLNVYAKGFVSALPMPFSQGLTIEISNGGNKPLGRLRMTASVLRDDPHGPTDKRLEFDRRLRLKGWLDHIPQKLNGWGRWSGIVYAQPKNLRGGFDFKLKVDGEQVPDWINGPAFFGFGSKEDGVYRLFSGHAEGLAWRFLLLTPVEYRKSIVHELGDPTGTRLLLQYERPADRP